MADIRELAQELVEALRPGCDRISLAGSIRRGKVAPKDIEIVCIAKPGEHLRNLFGEIIEDLGSPLDDCINVLLYTPGDGWLFDMAVKRNGPRYKRLKHRPSGVACDLFIVTAESWGAQMVIRTGPADFSQALMTRALRLGLKQDGGRLWRLHRDDTRTRVECPEEIDYFTALQVPWLEPHMRTADALARATA